MMQTRQQQQAFTLLEVIIALVVLAIALLALTQAGLMALHTQGRLQAHLQAQWVAENTLVSIQTGLIPLSADQDQVSGYSRMGHLNWHWKAQAASLNPDQTRVVSITVTQPQQALVWHDKGLMEVSHAS